MENNEQLNPDLLKVMQEAETTKEDDLKKVKEEVGKCPECGAPCKLINRTYQEEIHDVHYTEHVYQPPAEAEREHFTEIDKARFWTKVETTDYCWPWKANKNKSGYGMFKHHGYDENAQRVAYKITKGYIPEGLHVLHKCDNPICVNPDHLFTGTHQDNMDDRTRKGRGKVLGRASRYYGVAFRNDSNNWRAQVFCNKKHISLGSYSTEELAAKAYDKAVLEMGLELPLNFREITNESGEKEVNNG